MEHDINTVNVINHATKFEILLNMTNVGNKVKKITHM